MPGASADAGRAPYTGRMTAHEFDPMRLHVAAFAKGEGQLEGRWPVAEFARLGESIVADEAAPQALDVTWRVRGETRQARSGDAQVWLHLQASTGVPLECQRCLQPVQVELQVERSFLFVHGEEAAAQLDEQIDEDVLPLTRALDLRGLIEDELLLAMPLVPRHLTCPVPLPRITEEEATPQASNPFDVLAALKGPGSLN